MISISQWNVSGHDVIKKNLGKYHAFGLALCHHYEEMMPMLATESEKEDERDAKKSTLA